MIKKARITEAHNVLLFCDECDTAMERVEGQSGYKYDKVSEKLYFNYICPKCGRQETNEHVYPYQIIMYDAANAVSIDE